MHQHCTQASVSICTTGNMLRSLLSIRTSWKEAKEQEQRKGY